MTALNQKSIIVTGGGSGIGAAAVLLVARAGARVTVADINEAGGQDVVGKVLAEGGEAQFVQTDISDERDVQAMVQAAVQKYGRLDGAFNNAGIPGHSHQGDGKSLTCLDTMPLEIFRRGIEINVIGTFLCMKYEIAAMKETGGGAIVNTSSGAGVLAIAGAPDYVAAKHAVIGLTKSAALERNRADPRQRAGPRRHPHTDDGGLIRGTSASLRLGGRDAAEQAAWQTGRSGRGRALAAF